MSEAIETTAVEVEAGTDVVPANLFHGDSPADVLKRARETAEAFKPVVASHSVGIQGKQHITVEGWQTLGAMLGVSPVCTWTRKLDNGWEARVEARTLDGRVIGAAEAECLRDEGRWAKADDYAVRSMAQTRATSKALASVLRFVATLAGASGTPAEEVPREGFSDGDVSISDKQKSFLERLLKDGGAPEQERLLILDYASAELTGGRGGTASQAIDGLKGADAAAAYGKLFKDARSWNAKQAKLPGDTSDLPPAEPEDQGTTL